MNCHDCRLIQAENIKLRQDAIDKDKLIDELVNENREYRRVKEAYETAISRWERSNEGY